MSHSTAWVVPYRRAIAARRLASAFTVFAAASASITATALPLALPPALPKNPPPEAVADSLWVGANAVRTDVAKVELVLAIGVASSQLVGEAGAGEFGGEEAEGGRCHPLLMEEQRELGEMTR